jgi:hypothetical protein
MFWDVDAACHTEVEELWYPCGRHDDVVGFDVAVHDSLLVYSVDSGTNGLEETEPCLERGPGSLDEDIEWLSVDKLHHEGWGAVARLFPPVELRNIGMVEPGQDSGFVVELLLAVLPELRDIEELQRHPLLDVVSDSRVDLARGTDTDPFLDHIRADRGAGAPRVLSQSPNAARDSVADVIRWLVVVDEVLDLVDQAGVIGTCLLQLLMPQVGWQPENVGPQVFDASPTLVAHFVLLELARALIQARPKSISLFAVLVETRSSSAISTRDRP